MGVAVTGEPLKVSSEQGPVGPERGVVIQLDDLRKPRVAQLRWHTAHTRIAQARQQRIPSLSATALADASHWAVELYSFKQRQALDLLEDLGWQHERFYRLHGLGPDWSALADEVLDAMECAASLFELEPGSVAGQNLFQSLVRRVPALNRTLDQLEPAPLGR